MRNTETSHPTVERRMMNDAHTQATRTIDCGDGVRAGTPPVQREPGAGLAHAAFALARSGPTFGSSARSFGEQHQAI